MDFAKRRAARSLALQRIYKPPEGPACRQGSIPPPSAYFFAFVRFVARSRVSRHQVMGFTPRSSAASQIARFSASVSGIFMSSSRRSSGAFGGRPIPMTTNHIHKNFKIKADSGLTRLTYCGYNKSSEKKTPSVLVTRAGRSTTRRFRPIAS
jgi:hypothetical protein